MQPALEHEIQLTAFRIYFTDVGPAVAPFRKKRSGEIWGLRPVFSFGCKTVSFCRQILPINSYEGKTDLSSKQSMAGLSLSEGSDLSGFVCEKSSSFLSTLLTVAHYVPVANGWQASRRMGKCREDKLWHSGYPRTWRPLTRRKI
jgi:hypothetical protein